MAMDLASSPTARDANAAIRATFGPLSVVMLENTELSPAWRVNFLANFFVGPLYRELQERYGLSRPQFVVLYCLAQQPGLVARDVSLVTGLPKNSISRAVSELLNAGRVRRGTDDADKRAKPLSLTAQGDALLAEVVPLFIARQTAMLEPLDPDEKLMFQRLLDKIIDHMPTWVDAE
ncbi:MAG: MarR family winged helix-turn-helix transcriptional regulator [Pseudomonadota bacterium]